MYIRAEKGTSCSGYKKAISPISSSCAVSSLAGRGGGRCFRGRASAPHVLATTPLQTSPGIGGCGGAPVRPVGVRFGDRAGWRRASGGETEMPPVLPGTRCWTGAYARGGGRGGRLESGPCSRGFTAWLWQGSRSFPAKSRSMSPGTGSARRRSAHGASGTSGCERRGLLAFPSFTTAGRCRPDRSAGSRGCPRVHAASWTCLVVTA